MKKHVTRKAKKARAERTIAAIFKKYKDKKS